MAISMTSVLCRRRMVGVWDAIHKDGSMSLIEIAAALNLKKTQMEDVVRFMCKAGYLAIVGKRQSATHGNNAFFVYGIKDAIPANFVEDAEAAEKAKEQVAGEQPRKWYSTGRRGVLGQMIYPDVTVIPYRKDPLMSWIPQRVAA